MQARASGWRADPGTLPLLRERAVTDEHEAVRRDAGVGRWGGARTLDAAPRSRLVTMACWDRAVDRIEEVMTMTATPEPVPVQRGDEEVSTEELMRRQGVGPVESLKDLAHPDLWDSDEEYQQFLADLYASRRAGMA